MTDEHLWIVLSEAGDARDLAIPMRQQPWWDDHAAFINALIDEGNVLLGGPLDDEGGAVLVMRGADAAAIRARLADDPWYRNSILRLVDVKRWVVLIDEWGEAARD